MIKAKIHKSFKKNDLETSKLILYKLIKHYSYNSIVDYLLNPNKINNPKLEIIMKRLINKIGVDTLAFLLCNDNLNNYNINNSKEEEKTFVKSNYDNEKEQSKFKASIKKLKKKYKNKLIKKNNAKNDIYKYNKYKFKYKIKKRYYHYKVEENYNNNSSSSKDSNKMSEESDSNNNDFNSSINSNSAINSNINNNYNNYSDLNDFSEFCDSNINNEDIINIVNEMEEEEDKNENQKEEKKESEEEEEESEIILDETNSYVNSIIYKEPSNGELYYYIFESFNEDKTLNMKCIDELCKSKGIYNTVNKQIIILVQHTIIYEEHCYLKPNFGGEELNLEIFDFIKDSPDIKGIEILKSKEKYIKKDNKKIKLKKLNEENEDNLMDEENINGFENIINDENKMEEENFRDEHNQKEYKKESIYQNKIVNNIIQIIKINDKEKNEKNKKIKNKENFTLINLTIDDNKRSESNYTRKRNLKSCSRNRNYSLIGNDDIKLVDKKNNIKEEKDNNEIEKIGIKKEEIKEEEIKKEEIKEEGIKKEKVSEQNDDIIHKNSNSKVKNKNDNLDISYNYIEFNIDNIKKFEGTENCYSKKVYEINLQNKKVVDEQNKIIKDKRDIKKSKERMTEKYFSRSPSRSISSSYLMLNENESDNESQVSKLSVISHIKNKKYEEKIIIDENDSFFSLDLLTEKDKEKINKKLNDETIFLSDDSDKRKRLERIQKKYQERQLKKYLKKNKLKKLFFKVNERKIRDEEIINKRRIFGIIRKSYSPFNTVIDEKEENENDDKNDFVENDDKKRFPIFGIYNPNKHNPKFFVNNIFNKK